MLSCDNCGKSADSLTELPEGWRQILLRDGIHKGVAIQDALLCADCAQNWCVAGDEKSFELK